MIESSEPGNLEPAVADWYRRSFQSRLRQRGESHSEPELESDLEASISAGKRPSESTRLRLEDLGRRSAEEQTEGRRFGRSRAAMLGRRFVRRLCGWSPHQCAPIGDVRGIRVLHAIGDLQIGGAQQLVIDLACSAPVESPHRIVAQSIALRYRPPVAHAELPMSRTAMHLEFERFQPEVVHVCHYHASVLTRAWYRLLCDVVAERAIPLVQSHCVIGDPLIRGDFQKLVFCSEWSRSRSFVPGVPDCVISPGSPLEIFRAPRRAPSETPVIGVVYRLDGDKIDSTASEVLRAILERLPRSRIVVVGDGPIRQAIEARMQDADLSERVRWLGNVPFSRLPELHRSFDVEIAPVRAETFGSGSVHAISSGTPIVGYGVGALPSILRHPAAIAIPGSPDDLAARVSGLLENDDLHAEVHAAQFAHAEANFDSGTMNRRYHELFSQVVDRGEGRDSA